VVDSSDQEYRIHCPAPLGCKGTVVNPELSVVTLFSQITAHGSGDE
jgi:hypothetical protein